MPINCKSIVLIFNYVNIIIMINKLLFLLGSLESNVLYLICIIQGIKKTKTKKKINLKFEKYIKNCRVSLGM
jgi:hypothetical protein